MVEIVEAARIARPPDVVWAALADFGEIGAWAPNVDHSCLTTDRRDGVGTVRRVQVGRNALLERVVTWSPGQELAYEIEGLPPVVRSVTNTWTLAPADGATAATLTTRIDTGPRPPRQLVARVIGRVLARASREMLAGLQARVEEST